MASLLISFCNVFPRGLGLGVYDFDRAAFEWLDLSPVTDDLRGVTGLTRQNGQYWCLAQIPRPGVSALVAFDDDLNLRETYELSTVRQAHSMIPFDGGLLVVDTGGNGLVWVELPRDGSPLREVEYWRYCDERGDAVHLNSVACVGGKLYASLFGRRPDGGWKLATAGLIVDVGAGRPVYEGVFHPHTLTNIDESLHWLESGTGSLHRLSASGDHQVVTRLDGYTRGLGFDATSYFIATSMPRRRSSSTGTPHATSELPPTELRSWIYRVNRATLEFERHSLTEIGAEIYDIVVLPSTRSVDVDESVNPVVQRIWKCEDDFERQGTYLRTMLWQKEQALAVVDQALTDVTARLAAGSSGLDDANGRAHALKSLDELSEYVKSVISFKEG